MKKRITNMLVIKPRKVQSRVAGNSGVRLEAA
jgi:hypothetical protein